MKHLGDITKIDGSKIAPVDIKTGGSPCQDLSVAGKCEGLTMQTFNQWQNCQYRLPCGLCMKTNGYCPFSMTGIEIGDIVTCDVHGDSITFSTNTKD